MSADESHQVRILTLNCWGLKVVSKKRCQRIAAISDRLRKAESDYDIVALQEVWVEQDYETLRQSVSHYLPYCKRWFSGVIAGPGLVVFSRWPIESAWIFRFPLNGRPSAFWRGDWYVGKAAGSCVILHPSGRKIEIINAHLHAPYAPVGDASYACHRASQAWDMSGLVSRAIQSGNTIFVTGDLNYRPQSVGLRLFELRAKLSDAWLSTHEPPALPSKYRHKTEPEADGSSLGSGNSGTRLTTTAAASPATARRNSDAMFQDSATNPASRQFNIGHLSPRDQIDLAGVTSDSQLNTWRKNYNPNRAKRLDYIFFDANTATAVSSKVTFTEQIPGVGCVSDHFGVTATFELKASTSGAESSNTLNANLDRYKEKDSVAHYNEKLQDILDDILQIIDDYKPVSRFQALWRLSHFWLSNAVLVGLSVSVWWGAARNRAYVGFIFVIVGVLVAVTGYVNGLIGFLFGRNERRALIEFENQIRLAKASYQ